MRASTHPTVARRGVTLLELLVVMGIMLLLLAVAIPAMQFLPESRRIREAARSVNVFFGAARNKAITTGRPVGVILERLDRQPQACAVLRQAEVPPAYGGDVEGAMVLPALSGGYVRLLVKPSELSPGLIRRGDSIQLNYQGPFYMIIDDRTDNSPAGDPSPPADPGRDFPLDPSNDVFIDFDPPGFTVDASGWIDSHWLTLAVDPKGGYSVPWGPGSLPVPFKIYRQPVASSGRVLELSRGAVIDLAASGFDSLLPDARPEVANTFEPDPTNVGTILQPVIVMFFPNGSVQQVYYSRRTYDRNTGNFAACVYQGWPVAEPIHFLVGKWERMAAQPRTVNLPSPGPWPLAPSLAEDGLHNMHDATNLWVSLNPQTGLVTVAPLAADDFDVTTNMNVPLGATLAEQLYNGRRMVREAQISEGGR